MTSGGLQIAASGQTGPRYGDLTSAGHDREVDRCTAVLDDPVSSLKGVGPKFAQRLQRLGISSLRDVLFHRPIRYQNRCRIHTIDSLDHGAREIMICGQVMRCVEHGWKRKSLAVEFQDDTGSLWLRIFGDRSFRGPLFDTGTRLFCFGNVTRNREGRLEMVQPECVPVSGASSFAPGDTLTAVYPAAGGIRQNLLRSIVQQTLRKLEASLDGKSAYQRLVPAFAEVLPAAELRRLHMSSIDTAFFDLHFPVAGEAGTYEKAFKPASRRRLACEELLVHYLAARTVRRRGCHRQAAKVIPRGTLGQRFLSELPFSLTAGQQRAIDEIGNDLSAKHPMMRLLHGDVGCGKTVVAACAILRVIEAGMQAAVLAPTEVLSRQHYRVLREWFQPLGIRVECLTGGDEPAQRSGIRDDLAAGNIAVVVGTHALLQEAVHYHNLGLVVVDEQHRFGVEQRYALLDKGMNAGCAPHQLIISATPIPRTLAMTLYADLDLSVIDELPPGRKTVDTAIMPQRRRKDVLERICQMCRDGHQVYWVCTLIDRDSRVERQAAIDAATELAKQLPGLRIDLVHGRMATPEKDRILREFADGGIDVLVATTVIEVGVDAANAALMVIEDAERLGLSQLHQLRGRVGRSHHKSYCILLYRPPLTEQARQRLAALRGSSNGFELAQLDLDIRGSGEVFGTRQAGGSGFRFADVFLDEAFIDEVRRIGDRMLQEHRHQVPLVMRRWLGPAGEFAQV